VGDILRSRAVKLEFQERENGGRSGLNILGCD
jgi:hypothetical protein